MEDKVDRQVQLSTRSCATCYLCGSKGEMLYQSVFDFIFGVGGRWGFRRCENRDCGLMWLDPVPLEEEIHKAYRSYYTHAEMSTNQAVLHPLYKKIRDGYLQVNFGYTRNVGSLWYRLLAPIAHYYPTGADEIGASVMFLSEPSRDARVLDIGCGDGEFLARMRDLGWTVEGNDFDPAAVAAARSRGVKVSVGELTEESYPEAYFDAVTMKHLIEHVYDPSKLLKTVKNLLKPDGKVILLTPNTRSWGHQYFKQDWRGLEVPRHIHLFNPSNIEELFYTAGFNRVKTRTLTRGARYILSMSQAIRSVRLHDNGLVGYNGSERKLQRVFYQFWERAIHIFQMQSGEEILVIAQK
jgi:2-polyprenyl-3-methyl-5-hydroxy-6-metoxy-1,4-benzoquinol methylase